MSERSFGVFLCVHVPQVYEIWTCTNLSSKCESCNSFGNCGPDTSSDCYTPPPNCTVAGGDVRAEGFGSASFLFVINSNFFL